jgi:hypothetical protein
MDGACGQPVRGWSHVGGAECALPAGHDGYHSGHTFTCDGCGKTYRGEPYRSGRPHGWSDEEFGLCFLCVKTGERTPADLD